MSLKTKSGNILSYQQAGFTHKTSTGVLVSDLNSATDVLTEYYTNNSTANRPTTESGTYNVWVHKVNANSIVQYATLKAVDAPLWMRHYNGVWGDWVKVCRPLDVYPVGSIYKSNTSTNPAQYFGGTWTQISSVETCTIVGQKVVTPQSRMYAELFTLAQVQTMLHDEFGIDAADITDTNVFVDCSANYWGISNHAVLTTFYDQASTTYFAYFSGTSASNQDVRYIISYNREQYTFVRTA